MTTDTVLQKRLLDHLRTAVMMLDGDLRVRYLNPAAEMLLATSSERQGRVIDHDSAGSMEQKKREGYF